MALVLLFGGLGEISREVRSVLDGAPGLLGGLAPCGVLRLEYGDLLEAHGFSYMTAAVGLTAI
jgi:hypothetical protein